MSFASQCPVCKTILEFPDHDPPGPVMCPVCSTRYKIQGKMLAHLTFSDFYEILGISQYADQVEIKKAIRAAILKHHPDRNPGDPEAETRIRQVLKAKEILSDSTNRRLYDSVFSAKPLNIWKKQAPRKKTFVPKKEPVIHHEPVSAGMGDGTRQRGEQYYTYDDSAEISVDKFGRRRVGDPDDPTQEVILIQGGVPINLSSKRAYRQFHKVRIVWQIAGSIVGALAGMIIGISNGTLPGGLVLALLGAVMGWLFTSYPGGLVVIGFFTARLFIMGIVIAVAASKYISGFWFPPGIFQILKVIQFTTASGAIAFGLWSISTSRFVGHEPFTVHAISLRTAALGSWLGAIVGCLVLFVKTYTLDIAQSTIWYWFIGLTIWLILDTAIFGRTWVFIRKVK